MLLCGIDIGTTNTKALLCDADGAILARANLPAAELDAACRLDPHAWSAAVENVFHQFRQSRSLAGESILCSLAVQGGSFVTLDAAGQPTDRATSWLALASDDAVDDLRQHFSDDEFYHATGWPIGAWLAASKLRDRQRSAATRLRRDDSIVTVPAAILRAFGAPAITDITDAQITGLFDIARADWWLQMLDTLHLNIDQLPLVERTARILCEDVNIAGLRVSFATSQHDQYAAMRACNLDNHRIMLATGSAWVVNRRSSTFITDAARCIHPGHDLNAGCGAIATLGPVGKHFDAMLSDLKFSYADLPAMLESISRCDIPSSAIHLDRLSHIGSPAERIRRFIEGQSARLAHLFDTIGVERSGSTITMTGGAVAFSVWPQIIADVTGMTVEAVQFDELTALGAIRLTQSIIEKNNTNTAWPSEATVRYIHPNSSITSKYDAWLREHQFAICRQETQS